MFDNIQAYTGNIIGETPPDPSDFNQVETASKPQTPEEVLEYASREAEEIKEAARQEASAERDAILAHAKSQAEQLISENVVNAALNLRMELLSSKVAMGEVLTNAMDTIVGKIGHDKMALAAIENAIVGYSTDRKLIVYGNSKTLERLRLVAIGAKKNLREFGFVFQLDAGLADGRCVLSHGDARVEVGLDSQIDALKKVFHADSARAQKAVQSSLASTGKLM